VEFLPYCHMRLRVGIVPEHFSLPLRLGVAKHIFEKYNVELTLEVHGKGTGSMCRALRNNELDVALTVTEGVIYDIASNGRGIQIISSYVESPLHWGIHVLEESEIFEVDDLKGKVFGVSRMGSGSHLMACVLSIQSGWDPSCELKLKVMGDLIELLEGLKNKTSDAFLWDPLTVKPFSNKYRVRTIGETITPWPCFMVVAREELLRSESNRGVLERFLNALQDACAQFISEPSSSIEYISSECHLSMEDSKKWFEGVHFSEHGNISKNTLNSVISILKKAQLLTNIDDDDDVDIETFYDSSLANMNAG